jgi:hypothetical protein
MRIATLLLLAAALVAACGGDDDSGDTATPTATAAVATDTEPPPTPTEEPTAEPTNTPEATPTPEIEALVSATQLEIAQMMVHASEVALGLSQIDVSLNGWATISGACEDWPRGGYASEAYEEYWPEPYLDVNDSMDSLCLGWANKVTESGEPGASPEWLDYLGIIEFAFTPRYEAVGAYFDRGGSDQLRNTIRGIVTAP